MDQIRKTQIKDTIVDVVLPILGLTAMLTVAVIAPNAVQIFDYFGKPHRFTRRKLYLSLRNLEKRGYIHSKGERNAWRYTLTRKGKQLLRQKQINQLTITKPLAWDRKWRIVIFDVPEKYRIARNALRAKLRLLGFRPLNLSVWVLPYECRDEMNALTAYYKIGHYVRYLLVDSFDGDDEMGNKFFNKEGRNNK